LWGFHHRTEGLDRGDGLGPEFICSTVCGERCAIERGQQAQFDEVGGQALPFSLCDGAEFRRAIGDKGCRDWLVGIERSLAGIAGDGLDVGWNGFASAYRVRPVSGGF
jgi:hypothetical protein